MTKHIFKDRYQEMEEKDNFQKLDIKFFEDAEQASQRQSKKPDRYQVKAEEEPNKRYKKAN